ncbi:hypothetical protein ACTVKF_18525 [Serratia marcescens]|uniref:hypothetical protein n=1 Tax=Serratia TaxID=613 RepID=UPI00159EEFE4|nr:hypothetical protein [Serratia marcescens]MDX6807919.1 hypothetical protein [Serratia marcescens]HBC7448612.1 hypothetical protein [Serratia marcescens]
MDKFSEMSHAERIAYLASKVALAKSYDSPVLTVPIPDLEIPLAELEAKDKRIAELEAGHQEAAKQIASWRRIAKQNIEEREKDLAALDAERQKITELEVIRTDASLVFKEIGNELGCNPDNESIMMAIDALKERLATPVRLPDSDIDSALIMAHWCSGEEVNAWVKGINYAKQQIRAAGFTVEGDE